MDTAQIVLIVSTVIALGTMASIYVCYGLMYLKVWLFDEKHSPNLEGMWISKIIDRIIGLDPWLNVVPFCFLLWFASLMLSLLILTPALKFLVLAVFVVVGLHALRWGIRAGKAINKVKSMVHKHKEE